MALSDDLTAINTAISAIESGAQEYQIGSRRIKRADLRTLYEHKNLLQRQIEEANSGGMGGVTYVATFDGR